MTPRWPDIIFFRVCAETYCGDLLMKMGRLSEAREEIQRAIAVTKNLREQELLANRLKQLEKAAFPV